MENISSLLFDGHNTSNDSLTEDKTDHENIKCVVCNQLKSLTKELFTIQLFFPTVTFIANSITLAAIYRARGIKPSLRLSLINLSITDIMSSLVYIYHIAFAWTSYEVTVECLTRYALFVSSIILTLNTILFMSVDRFLSIFMPFVYEKMNGPYYVTGAIGICWLVMLANTTLGFSLARPDAEGCFYPLLMRPEIHLWYGVISLTIIAIIITLNSIIFVYTRIQITKIAATLVGEEREKQISRLAFKSTKTTISVVVPFVLMNMPMYTLMIYFYIENDYTNTADSLLVINALSSLSLVNSLINPSIYIWRVNQIRGEIKKTVNQLFGLCRIRGREIDGDFDSSKRRSTYETNVGVSRRNGSNSGETVVERKVSRSRSKGQTSIMVIDAY